MRWMACVLAIGLSGCAVSSAPGGPTPAPSMSHMVSVDESLAAEVPYIRQAAQNWETAIPGLHLDVVLQPCSQSDSEICMSGGSGDAGSLYADDLGYTRAESWGSSILIFLDTLEQRYGGGPLLWQLELTTTIGHELGHALGCVHIGPGNLMSPASNEAMHAPTPADADDFWAHF